MKTIISRTYQKDETIGTLYVMDGEKPVYHCKTIELAWNGNQHNSSCIPEGTYDTIKIVHPQKGECFRVLNVPDREGILIHIGNFAAGKKVDTLGCILPGIFLTDLNFDGFVDVGESTKALHALYEVLPDAFKLYIL